MPQELRGILLKENPIFNFLSDPISLRLILFAARRSSPWRILGTCCRMTTNEALFIFFFFLSKRKGRKTRKGGRKIGKRAGAEEEGRKVGKQGGSGGGGRGEERKREGGRDKLKCKQTETNGNGQTDTGGTTHTGRHPCTSIHL